MAAVESPVTSDSTATAEEKFEAALNVIKSLPKNGPYKPSPHMMLKFYSYYKQATEGPCNKSKPWAWDLVNKAKWDAWSKLGDMPKTKAMDKYVENLKLVMIETPPPDDDQIVETMPATDNVQDFIKTLGNFYEVVELEPPEHYKKHVKTVTSTPHKAGEEPTMSDGCTAAQVLKMNGDVHESDPESEADEPHSVNGHLDLNGHQGDLSGQNNSSDPQQAGSDSEEEFCDTAEEMQSSSDSPLHSYTMVGTDGHAENSSKSESLSTMGSNIDGDGSSQDENEMTSSTVKVRTRGGEHGTRGSDITSPMQAPSSSRSGELGSGNSRNLRTNPNSTDPGPSGGGGGGRGPPCSYSEVQNQIASTLLQLQRDMTGVLNRLATLEALTVGRQALRHRTVSGDSTASGNDSRHRSKTSMWPFPELSVGTLFFIVMWPFVARWLVSIWSKRRLNR